MRGLAQTVLRDALVVVVLSGVFAIGFNLLRGAGIPFVAREHYRILVPCPEPGGEIVPLDVTQVRWGDPWDLVVDAREATEHAGWSPPGARSIPFDYLDPVSDEALADLVASRARRVVVFGDGLRPDTGEELAREISGRGVRNVHFIPGGAGAVLAALKPGPAGAERHAEGTSPSMEEAP